MERRCFLLRVKEDRVEQYLQTHQVWPEMLAAISAAGFHNYSLFIRPDGLVVGYFEAEDPEAAQAAIAQSEVSARWEEIMASFFVGGSGKPEDRDTEVLSEYFHLP